MERSVEYKCPWQNGVTFSEAQAIRDRIKVKTDKGFVEKKVIQCPHCGKRVKKTRWGWKKQEGRL